MKSGGWTEKRKKRPGKITSMKSSISSLTLLHGRSKRLLSKAHGDAPLSLRRLYLPLIFAFSETTLRLYRRKASTTPQLILLLRAATMISPFLRLLELLENEESLSSPLHPN